MNRLLKFLLVGMFLSILGSGINGQTLSIQVPPGDIITSQTTDFGAFRNIVTDVDPYTGKQVYVWGEQDASPSGTLNRDIWCAIYDKDQNLLIAPFRVNFDPTNDQAMQRVRINPNDQSFVITWAGTNSGTWDIYAKKLKLNLTSSQSLQVKTVSDLLVNTTTAGSQYYPYPVFHGASGELIIGFTGTGTNGTNDVFYQRVNYTGTLLQSITGFTDQLINSVASTQVLNQNITSMEYSTFSNQVILVYNSNESGSYDVIRRMLSYTPASTNITGTYSLDAEFIANTTTAQDQEYGTILINQTTGSYAIAYQSDGNKSGWGVYYKVFSSTGTLLKDEFSLPEMRWPMKSNIRKESGMNVPICLCISSRITTEAIPICGAVWWM